MSCQVLLHTTQSHDCRVNNNQGRLRSQLAMNSTHRIAVFVQVNNALVPKVAAHEDLVERIAPGQHDCEHTHRTASQIRL